LPWTPIDGAASDDETKSAEAIRELEEVSRMVKAEVMMVQMRMVSSIVGLGGVERILYLTSRVLGNECKYARVEARRKSGRAEDFRYTTSNLSSKVTPLSTAEDQESD